MHRFRLSPTIVRHGGFRLFFFSREEARAHVHVSCADGEAKFWLEPRIELAENHGLSRMQLRSAESLVKVHHDTIRHAREHDD